MSGFYLTKSILSGGFSAAEESVKLFDDLFGNTEPSRALASIISLVRRELVQDALFTPGQYGKIATLSALTKALTAFACLQNATHRRSLESFKLRVIYDCTVISRKDGSRDLNPTEGSTTPNTNKRRARTLSRASLEDDSIQDIRYSKETGHSWRDDLGQNELDKLRHRTHSYAMSGRSQASIESEDELVYELGQMVGNGDGEQISHETDPDVLEQLHDALEKVQHEKGYRRCGTSYEAYEVQFEREDTTTITTTHTIEQTRSTSPASEGEWSHIQDAETLAQAYRQDSEEHPVEGRRRLKVMPRLHRI